MSNLQIARSTKYLCSLVVILAAPGALAADTVAWKSGAVGAWFDAANWAGGKLPAAGDEVEIPGINSKVTLGKSPPQIKSIVVEGTLVFSGYETVLEAGRVRISSKGTVTLPSPFKTREQASRIHIKCSGELVIESGGRIDADAKGYAGGTGTAKGGDATSAGFGPGAGGYPETWGASAGGSHGGKGGAPTAKPPYGSASDPNQPGSGGGGGNGTGGAGGGAVRIDAARLVVDGTISCNGGDDPKKTWSGGGSGGSVWITCQSISGEGRISADGGSGSVYAGGGAGGRVAVHYDEKSQSQADSSSVLFSATGGANGWGGYGIESPDNYGEPGTLFFSGGAIPGRMLPHTGAVVTEAETPVTDQAMTVDYWMPWRNNRPLVQVEKERYLEHPRPRVAALVSRDYVGPNLEMRETRSVEILDDVGENIVARWSPDNGRTWSEPVPVAASNNVDYQGVTVWEGGGSGTYDPNSKRLVGFFLRQIKVGSIYHNFTYSRVSQDQGRTWSEPRQLRYEDGGDFDPQMPLDPNFLDHNEGYLGTNVLLHSSGVLIHCLAHTNAPGDAKNDARPWRMGSVLMLGRWNAEAQQYEWQPGARVEISPELSARGLMEPCVAELADGRVLVVWRGSDQGWDGTVAKVEGRKWFSISTDAGQTLSPAGEWRYSDGSRFYSPSSIHRMIRHSVTGKLYWLGNICAAPPHGNHPRYPLGIAEVDEEAASLKKHTVTLIDDRDPKQHGFTYQLSNFALFENRETHEIELYLTTYGQEKNTSDWATADCYHYRLLLKP